MKYHEIMSQLDTFSAFSDEIRFPKRGGLVRNQTRSFYSFAFGPYPDNDIIMQHVKKNLIQRNQLVNQTQHPASIACPQKSVNRQLSQILTCTTQKALHEPPPWKAGTLERSQDWGPNSEICPAELQAAASEGVKHGETLSMSGRCTRHIHWDRKKCPLVN